MRIGKEEIRQHFDTAGWDELITKCMGGEPERKEKGGEEWIYECYGHDDNHPSLRINRLTGLYTCPVCDIRGDGLNLWQETQNCNFSQTCDQIAEMIGHEAWTTTSTSEAGLTIGALADAKGFSTSDLTNWGVTETTHSGNPAVRIAYLDEGGKEITHSLRLSLDGRNRFRAPSGEQRKLYGLNWLPVVKEQDRVVFVEGESDCWTCWTQSIPAIGIPGASGWKDEWSDLFQDVSSVFVIKEPDQGGTTLVKNLQKSFGKRLRVVELQAKDANELYLKDRDNFLDRLEESMRNSYSPAIKRPSSLRLSDLNSMADVNWLWDEWIPKGALTLVVGETGVGKSWLSCYFIACAMGMIEWPSRASKLKHKVCLLETESMRSEYGRRLTRMGLKDDDGLVLPYREEEGKWYVPKLPGDLEELVEPFIEDGNPWVLVVDSLSGAHQMRENDSEMRTLLQALSGFADKHSIPVIAMHHLNKKKGQDRGLLATERVRGSSTIAQFARSIVGLEQPTQDGRIHVHSLKSTFARKPDPFGFRITEMGTLEICEPPEVKKSRATIYYAKEFLQDLLAKEGAMKASAVIASGLEEGFGETMLRRAREKLHVISDRGKWKLPSQN
ncbi:MAG: AAA family ATPase [Candidatus Thorarchaeota archaeon]